GGRTNNQDYQLWQDRAFHDLIILATAMTTALIADSTKSAVPNIITSGVAASSATIIARTLADRVIAKMNFAFFIFHLFFLMTTPRANAAGAKYTKPMRALAVTPAPIIASSLSKARNQYTVVLTSRIPSSGYIEAFTTLWSHGWPRS